MLDRLVYLLVVIGVVAVAVPKVMPAIIASVTRDTQSEAVADQVPPARDNDANEGYSHRATLTADGRGHFAANAVVNGRSLDMLVDTGASVVALSADTARRLGIHPDRSQFTIAISTANGIATAAPVTLSEIRIGDVTVRGVPAVVMSGKGLGIDLLGMTFLSRLSKFQVGGGQLVLVQ